MLSFAAKLGRPSPGLLVHRDDPDREFAYDTGAERALARAAHDGWAVVSIKDDWTRVFPDQT